MKRHQLFEFNDQAWMPDWLRNYETDYLEALFTRLNVYAPASELIVNVLNETQERSIVDFGSGAGGPIRSLVDPVNEALDGEVNVLLTDKHPHANALKLSETKGIRHHPDPVDVFAIPGNLQGMRTIFDALHHFQPDQVQMILEDAANSGTAIAIFDGASRTAPAILGSIFIPLFVLVLTPFIRPFRWLRLLFTYLIPILPIIITWDGLVSHLRAYRAGELATIAQSIDAPDYQWRTGELKVGVGAITYLLGYPRGH